MAARKRELVRNNRCGHVDLLFVFRAVYHWNLPSNPVDIEQREGRVHRYKGLVIRSNLAAQYGLRPRSVTKTPGLPYLGPPPHSGSQDKTS